MNPYLTQRYGAALHHAHDEEDVLPDASVGWGRFPTSTHMQHRFISLPNRSPPRTESVVPEQRSSPPVELHVEEPQTAAARRQSNPSGTFEGSELFSHDVLKSAYVDPVAKEVIRPFQPTQVAQITAFLPMDVDSVMGKRLSRRAQLHVMPIDPTVRALEESQEAAARSEEKRQYEQMRRELERTHEALEAERETRRKDIRAAKRESRREHKRRVHRRQPHADATTITPEVLSTILTSVYANIPRPSVPAHTPPTIEVTAEEDTKAKLAKRIDAIYGAQAKREVPKGEGEREASKNAFLPRPLPRVNIPLSANVFFDQSRSVSPLALPSPDTADSPPLVNHTSSTPRYLLPTESWLCKGPEMHGVHLHTPCDDAHHHHHAGAADHDTERQPHPQDGGGLARALRLGRNDAPKSVRPFKH